jgi:riboflavin kinase/FMN adenylyltransferase
VTRTRECGSEGKPQRGWPSITNVGYRPTFDGQHRTIETYLLSALGGAPPEEISVEFLRRVRDERKFESPVALKEQILRDVARAQAYFRRLGGALAVNPAAR